MAKPFNKRQRAKRVPHNVPKRNQGKSEKTCPICNIVIKRRVKGRCSNCGGKIFLSDGEYFTISNPQQRLIVYNWIKYLEDTGIDIYSEEEDWAALLPSSDEVSVIWLKNEGWAANKLLELCKKDFELALAVIDEYHYMNKDRYDARKISLYFIVSFPIVSLVIKRARNRLLENKVKAAAEKSALENLEAKEKYFGKVFDNDEEDLGRS